LHRAKGFLSTAPDKYPLADNADDQILSGLVTTKQSTKEIDLDFGERSRVALIAIVSPVFADEGRPPDVL